MDERRRAFDAAVDVGFGGEVHYRVDSFFGEEPLDQSSIADVALDEAVAGIGGDVGQVLEVAGVGELVEVDQAYVGAALQAEPHEVRADKAAAAGDEKVFHCAAPAVFL